VYLNWHSVYLTIVHSSTWPSAFVKTLEAIPSLSSFKACFLLLLNIFCSSLLTTSSATRRLAEALLNLRSCGREDHKQKLPYDSIVRSHRAWQGYVRPLTNRAIPHQASGGDRPVEDPVDGLLSEPLRNRAWARKSPRSSGQRTDQAFLPPEHREQLEEIRGFF